MIYYGHDNDAENSCGSCGTGKGRGRTAYFSKLDLVLGNDITSPVAIKEFNKLGAENVFDKDKVTMVMDHFAPNKDIKAAQQCKMCRDFCGEKEITNFYDVGEMGIEHALLPKRDWLFQATP